MNPKKLNTALVIVLATVGSFMISCSNYGKKVAIEGTKGEVFYKGEGVNEADAKKLGQYLKEQEYFDDNAKSVQLKKEGKQYEVRLVVDYEKVQKTPGVDSAFTVYGAKMAVDIFDNTPTVIILCDKSFKDLKTYAYKPEILENPMAKKMKELKDWNQKTYANNTMYYNERITDDQANYLLNYLKSNEFFTENGNNDIIISKNEDESASMQFPVNKEFANEEGLARVDAFVKQMKTDLFKEVTLSFEVLDPEMHSLKTFTY